jgi:glycosyltransferase involved in cell wall biosynthesis
MFGAAGLLLIPSLWGEAFGMIGVEAFAQGTPVVGYNVGGIEEWCRCGAGILVSCGDIKAAAVAIQSIASDYAKWSNYSSCAKRIGETEFRESDFRKSLLTLLQPMLE